MKNSKSNFKNLVTRMDALRETEQGKLIGGISTFSSIITKRGINVPCIGCNIQCGCPPPSEFL